MFAKRLTTDSIHIGTPAKVNLFLQVLGKRPDGYHDINSLFQAVSLFDRLKFTLVKGKPGIQINLTRPSKLELDDSNLIAQAYHLMQDRFGLESGLEVELEKNIPIAAGLAGGSADAAATILACVALFDLPLSFGEMAELGLEIGSDLPFFFTRGQALIGGRGEKITQTDFPTDYWLILVTPNIAISTGTSYAALGLGLTKAAQPFSLNRSETVVGLIDNLRQTGNDFEEVHLRSFPILGRIKDGLLDDGALLARMSGSGPTVFGIYMDAPVLVSNMKFGQDSLPAVVVRPVTLPVRLL
ncbi:MAG: 4-(cytidine 5'-diphospho)-2-C-methyl-D-erythritol kinase [Candidatus Zixiibacteriota bacterium]|nr:MAG: 4-(cytidine 5'-diphospho)-2-C-methyl-D-erythritol kinase [candidate division Zixibacteria bacterium]